MVSVDLGLGGWIWFGWHWFRLVSVDLGLVWGWFRLIWVWEGGFGSVGIGFGWLRLVLVWLGLDSVGFIEKVSVAGDGQGWTGPGPNFTRQWRNLEDREWFDDLKCYVDISPNLMPND